MSGSLVAIRMAKDPTVWMRALRWHTYLGRSINEGDFYLAHPDIVETLEASCHRFSVRVPPPERPTRPPSSEPDDHS